jgi:hypothetical protein
VNMVAPYSLRRVQTFNPDWRARQESNLRPSA